MESSLNIRRSSGRSARFGSLGLSNGFPERIASRPDDHSPQDLFTGTHPVLSPPKVGLEQQAQQLALDTSQSLLPGPLAVAFQATTDALMGKFRNSHFSHRVEFASELEAKEALERARARLLSPNNWKEFGPRWGAASFQVYDQGNPKCDDKPVQQGDSLKIHLPDGLPASWVEVEKLESHEDGAEMVVRPSSDPRVPESRRVKHLFDRETTNVFSLTREGNLVEFSVSGLNESPNTDGNLFQTTLAKARTAGAWMGAKNPQWNAFTRKMLEMDEPS